MDLATRAEKAAKRAESLPAFSGLNLLHIRREITHLLSLIGRDRLFDEYTKHDASHVDKMLSILDWLIPLPTQEIMTPADWLMVVLSIYFHDLGMLVTSKEYANRAASGFQEFVDSTLLAGDIGADYRERLAGMGNEDRERYLYQEFVRHNHAARIRNWIVGQNKDALGLTDEIAAEVSRLLAPLGRQFARDLAFVCESHHLDDLADLQKYRVSQPYGDSNEETANLQYAAVILRTADLLHITSDRTPSVLFRAINPSDPVSQQEWAKQMAVTRVRPKIGTNVKGEPDPSAPQDTIEVHAYFRREDGFFGLTAYLSYVAEQLAKSHEWISQSSRKTAAPHVFPWTRLDDSNIETEGFIRDAFQFTLDQAKILDLLTGHTLYNDSSVVLRELVQNSLDAIKLRLYEAPGTEQGQVTITWESASRTLTVRDNGCGMTQDVIRNHLLRVGASLYQDAAFKKKHPGFSSISRFGIGVLSAFMIADSVEIVTSHVTEDQARRLSLRSVHGKYLVSLLDKRNNAVAASLGNSGSMFQLKVRHSVKMPDVVRTAQRWFIVPGCRVTVSIDGNTPIQIGYDDVRTALVSYLTGLGRRVVEDVAKAPADDTGEPPTAVVLFRSSGCDLACALEWSRFFHEWTFLRAPENEWRSRDERAPIGTCIEGIRVNFETPGYSARSIVALSNAHGLRAPKTNVARSGLETTPELDAMLKSIYEGYCEHAKQEISNLSAVRGHSLTWATQEAQFLLAPLWYGGRRHVSCEALNRDLLEDVLRNVPFLLVEDGDGRRAVSAQYLQAQATFWTIQCPFLRSADRLMRETATNASLRSIVKALGVSVDLPAETLLCLSSLDFSGWSESFAFRDREVSRFVLVESGRRLDAAWSHRATPSRWLEIPREWITSFSEAVGRKAYRYVEESLSTSMSLCRGAVDLVGFADTIGVRYRGETFLMPGSPIHAYLLPRLDAELVAGHFDRAAPGIVFCMAFVELVFGRRTRQANVEQDLRQFIARLEGGQEGPVAILSEGDRAQLTDSEFIAAVTDTRGELTDPAEWERRRNFFW